MKKWFLLSLCFLIQPVFADEPPALTKSTQVTFIATPFQAELAEKTWLEFIAKQKLSLFISCYGFTDVPTVKALIDAKTRGLAIVVLMDSTEGSGAHQAPLVKELKDAGIEVRLGKIHGQLLHAKMAIGDDQDVMLGSWNMSPSASLQFNDLMFIYGDRDIAAYYLKFWLEIYEYLKGHPKLTASSAYNLQTRTLEYTLEDPGVMRW